MKKMLDLVIKWAEINSYSLNLKGLQTMQNALIDDFAFLTENHNAKFEKFDLDDYEIIDDKGQKSKHKLGQALKWTLKSSQPKPKKLLLVGHLDTVYPPELNFNTCTLKDSILQGPGVTDLKGGLVVILFALKKFLHKYKELPIDIELFINPDEEIGSPGSQKLFPELAANNDYGLIVEPSLDHNCLAYKRKGTGNFTFVVHGKSAHVGRNFEEGKNAITIASELILDLNTLNENKNLILNIGKINSGGPLNVVPDLAVFGLNLRVDNAESQNFALQALNAIKEKSQNKYQNQIFVYGNFNRPAKIPSHNTDELLKKIQNAASSINIQIQTKNTGGACDGNNLQALGLAVIDSLGVHGGKIHSTEEYLEIDSLEHKTNLMLAILEELAT